MEKTANKSEFLGSEKLFPLLMKMSIPAIVGMMAAALYNVVDTIFVGRGVGPLGIAGLSIAFPLQLIVQSFAMMIGIGAASIISRRLGEKRYDDAENALGAAVAAIIIIGILILIVMLAFTDPILRLFGASEVTLPYARVYIRHIVWIFPFLAFNMAANNMVRAEGNPKIAMLTMLIGITVNIILDPIFIFVFNMGIKGAAIATDIGLFLSFIWILGFYLRKKSTVPLRVTKIKLRLKKVLEMAALGFPNFVQSAGMSILVMIINNTLLRVSGDYAVSTYGMLMRLLSFVIMPMIGLSQGFQPIAGFNYGARAFDRVKHILLLTVLSGTVVAVFFYGLIMIVPEKILGLFTTEPELIASSISALRTASLIMPVVGIQLVSTIYFQAIGKKAVALVLGLSRQFLILIPLVLILSRLLGEMGVWVSFPLSDGLSTIIAAVAIFFEIRHLNEIQKEQNDQLQESINADAKR